MKKKQISYGLQDIKNAIDKYEGDLVSAAEFLKIPLRRMLQHTVDNRNLRNLMEEYKKRYKELAQSKLHVAVKNDEQWAILHCLKQEFEQMEKNNDEKEEMTMLTDQELYRIAHGN